MNMNLGTHIPVMAGIVFHSDVPALDACLASLADSKTKPKVVVLDVSTSHSAKSVVAKRGAVWVDGSRNAGYAWGLHQLAKGWLDPDEIFVGSNSDVVFLPGSLDTLASNAHRLRAVCYPLQLLGSGAPAQHNVQSQLSLRNTLAKWFWLGRRTARRNLFAITEAATKEAAPIRFPPGTFGSGAVVAMPSEIWAATEGMDTDFFLYNEDKAYGTKIERLGIPAYLCGDAPVIHEGGTLSRGISKDAAIESIVSEQINWAKTMRSPNWIPVGLQVVALTARALAAAAMLREADTAIYFAALKFRLRHRTLLSAAPRASDGLRLPASTRR